MLLPRCGHLSKVGSSCSLSPPASSEPLLPISHFFVASADRKLSGEPTKKTLGIFFFRHNFSNFYKPTFTNGAEFRGALWDPKRLLPNIPIFLFVLVVPTLYGIIYRFRKKHTTTTLGWYILGTKVVCFFLQV